ncbi:MAG: hypothetical protein KC593_11300 [Myxococcales bacterium]|nr:hypothetical protein [Myxococcales bacterium]MCB9628664.1 hypothetical protein [Sandaracinaceae bacterium]
MSDTYETPTSRIIMLGLAFAALVAIGVMTVLRPELEQEPESETAADAAPEGLQATAPTTAPAAD